MIMKFSIFTWIFLGAVFSFGFMSLPHSVPLLPHVQVASAEDDDHEEDDEDDDHSSSSSSSQSTSSSTKMVTKSITTYETRQVLVTTMVTPPEYVTDTDGDSLVDAIDPDPSVPQQAYFTDDDGDSIPNALDHHPGDDDFAFFDDLTDADNNGIIDSYERR